ncbi:MAG: peptidase [Pirellulales bacterium]|nr:peptidase [Pirellulales bacterium]
MSRSRLILPLAFACLAVPAYRSAPGADILLHDGRLLSGKLGEIAGVAEVPKPPSPDGSGPLQRIAFLDDDLRRTFFPKRQIREVRQEDAARVVERYKIHQRVMSSGRTVQYVGRAIRMQPFDEFGRRIFTMQTLRGPENVIQGITELAPAWAKVEGITHVWDMRIATSSLPPDVLGKILSHQTNPTDLEQRKRVARFYLQAERYEDAYQELERILKDFAGTADIQEQLEPSIRAIRQLSAQRILSELRLRRDAGQHRLAVEMLNTFPSENVAGEILQAVREAMEEYRAFETQRGEVLSQFDQLVEKVQDEAVRKRIQPIRDELHTSLNLNTMDRLAAFQRMAGDDSLLPEEKVSLAISGWLVGSNAAVVKLPVALSLYKVRWLAVEYLNAQDALSRARILEQFHSEEGAVPSLLAEIVGHMRPPIETPLPADGNPGFYQLEVPGAGQSPAVRYLVQLPPEYDPYRRYPTIVALHGAGHTPEQEVEWWAGEWTEKGFRFGQATRHGYIMIAPAWATEYQKGYEYSAREHSAVLDSLRDACRRFSVDTDRVFLSGYSMGGDAAWDIGLAHPDLWAGVVPVVAKADRYCALYWPNAELVPYYFVCGELDGRKMIENARDLDRYLNRNYNSTVVEFQGRGHEHFSDEIQRLFDWMGRFRRNFFPREFTTKTMRRWDNFFWWLELDQLPPKAMVEPVDWPPERGFQPVETSASVTATNGLFIKTGAGSVRIWLSPDLVKLDQKVNIVVNGQRINSSAPFIEPKLETILEDVRTRGDRQHPFWAKIESATGRLQASR